LPKYKPSIFAASEYFIVRYNTITSVFKADIDAVFAPEAKEVYFFLAE